MAAVPQRTLNWLYSILIRDHYDPTQTYQDPNRTYYDVANALAQYPSLSPRTDVYTYETGFSTLLLLLAGTLPVSFRGTLYKFPVEVWIPTSYPREPPIVYVTPTHDMVVRVGQHVTLEGRVYHHYLAHWMEAWDKSTLVDLLFILRDVFATEPPVKYKQPVPQPPLSMPMPTPPPVPPLPPGFGPATSTPAMASPTPTPASQVPPPPPPKPGQVVEQQQQQQQQQPPPTGQYNNPPPLPPLPPEELERRRSFTPRVGPNSGGMTSPYRGQPPAPPHMNVHRRDSGAQQYPAYGWQQPPQHYPVQQQQQQLPNKYQTYPQPTAQVQHQRQFSSNPPPPPPPHPAPAPASQPTPITTTTPAKTMAPTPAPAPAPDLLTSPFDVDLPNFTTPSSALPPPIPPNPEKHALRATVSKTLAETLQSNVAQSESAAHALAAQSHSLHVAIAAVQGEISSLKTLNTTLQGNTGILKDSLGRADGVIADARCRLSSDPGQNNNSSSSSTADPGTRAGLPPIDEILVAPTVVGKQLYDLVAEETGIQQAIYALQGALVKGVIGVETWSRHTRGLAREAFLKRALMRKVARGLGHEGV